MRKKIFGALVALALALAPAAGANAAPYPPGPNDPMQHGVLDKYVGAPGDTITYTAEPGTYDSDEALTQVVRGPQGETIPVVLTVGPSVSDGSHTFTFTIPLDAKDGDQYEVDVMRADGTVWDHFVVTAVVKSDESTDPGSDQGTDPEADAGAGSSSGNDGGLAMTGSDIAITGIASGAVLLLATGIVLLLVRRRRQSAGATA